MYTISSLAVIMGLLIICCDNLVNAQNFQSQINSANSRINAVNSTATTNSHRISSCETSTTNLRNQMYSEVDALSNRIYTMQLNLNAAQTKLDQSIIAIDNCNIKITDLTIRHGLDNDKIAKLHSINLIWQANFRSLIKTFGSMKKVRFIHPKLNYIPVNYRWQ